MTQDYTRLFNCSTLFDLQPLLALAGSTRLYLVSDGECHMLFIFTPNRRISGLRPARPDPVPKDKNQQIFKINPKKSK